VSKHAANRFSRCQENVAKRTRVEDRTVHTYLYGIWKKFVDIVISLIGLVFFCQSSHSWPLRLSSIHQALYSIYRKE
jgi:lipopolysaccharide/colanic/teichoic acid biosynthesis glycosyltransferase